MDQAHSEKEPLLNANESKRQKRVHELEIKRKTSDLSLLSKKLEIRVNRPMIPLKITLLFMFGASSSVLPFLQVFLKQKGLTIEEIAYIYIFNPFIQFFGSLLSGIIADKIGRSKPVLLGNTILATLFLNCMFLIPNAQDCIRNSITMHCNSGEFYAADRTGNCNSSAIQQCEIKCSDVSSNALCNNFNNTFCSQSSNKTVIFYNTKNLSYITDNLNSINRSLMCKTSVTFAYQNMTNFCNNIDTGTCNLICLENISCNETARDIHILAFAMGFVLLILFNTTLSTSFRILDVTSMSMVKTYNSDFGRERVWSISGVLIFSILAGYAVDIATGQGNLKNYNMAIYLFNGLAFLSLLAVWKIEVQIEPPGKLMVKKSLTLLKNTDVIIFFIAVLILGTCWSFSKQFSSLYLDSIGAPSILLGLNPALNGLLGLPFLMSSNYWIKNFGSKNLLISGFAGHVIYFMGYAYLKDPWWSLPFEATGILTYHLLWVAVVRHSHDIAPEGLVATVISTAGALHYGIGKGTGSALGGLTMSNYGGPLAYKVMATTSGVTGILYTMYLFIRYLFRKQNFNYSPKSKDNKYLCK